MGGDGVCDWGCDDGTSPALAKETSISSCVRFLDLRNAIRLSREEAATEGSWRTAQESVNDMEWYVTLMESST